MLPPAGSPVTAFVASPVPPVEVDAATVSAFPRTPRIAPVCGAPVPNALAAGKLPARPGGTDTRAVPA